MECPICGSDDIEILNSKQKEFMIKTKVFLHIKNTLYI